ncbi:MAG: NAD(P)-binding domain-containing protein [Bacillota bacterium]
MQVTGADHLTAVELKRKIQTHTANVAVVGLGYVGLPLAVEKAKVGFHVLGIEQNPKRAYKVNNGENYILDVKDEDLKQVVHAGKLKAYTDFACLPEADVIVICVPTPLNTNRDPDISYIVNVTNEIANHLRPGQLVTLESTTYPGTTQEVILPKLEATGLKTDQDREFQLRGDVIRDRFRRAKIVSQRKASSIDGFYVYTGFICQQAVRYFCVQRK